jgi:hypothetical protein
LLTEWQIAAQYGQACGLKGVRHDLEQRRFAIAPGTVRQHHPIFAAIACFVQEAPDAIRFKWDR